MEKDICSSSEMMKEKKKNITNRQWLQSLSDADLAMWLLDRYTIHLKLDDYNCNVKVGLQSLIKGYTDSYLGLFNWLTEVHKDNIS